MKGLLIKDYYSIKMQIIVFSIIAVYFSVFTSGNAIVSIFPIIYASMLPYTSIAYDEQSKWDSLAKMMPYSKHDLVFSKYILGYLNIGLIYVITMIPRLGSDILKNQPIADTLLSLTICTLISLIIMAFCVPFLYWLGAQKGRFVSIIIPCAASGAFAGLFNDSTYINKILTNQKLIFFIILAVTIVVNLLSVRISIKLYKSKER